MNEAKMQSLFTKYVRKHHHTTAVFELKITKTKNLPFSKIEPHQITALKQTKHQCREFKLSDLDLRQKPYDFYQICNAPAFIVILFYKPRKPKYTYLIDIDDFLTHMQTTTRKSITEPEAKTLATHIYIL